MKKQAVIFDLDGTLLNTLDDLLAAVNHALESVSLNTICYEDARRFVGNGVPLFVMRAIVHAEGGDYKACEAEGFKPPQKYEECMRAFTEYYGAHSADRTRLYDGVREVLCRLKNIGVKTAVVTNKYDEAAQALRLKFFPETDAVVGTTESVRPKPSPDGVNKALEILGVAASDSVFVGDGETDVMTAKNCGIPVVAVTWGFRDRQVLEALAPDAIIDAPSELMAAIDAIE